MVIFVRSGKLVPDRKVFDVHFGYNIEIKMQKLFKYLGITIILIAGAQLSLGQNYSWTSNLTFNATNLGRITLSSDGKKMAAITPGANIYDSKVHYSVDAGVTWAKSSFPIPNTTYKGLTGIASSSDGQRVVVVGFSDYSSTNIGFIYLSSDSGQTWNQTTAPWENWVSVTSSADGKILVATFDFGVMVSTNFGASWIDTLGTRSDWINLTTSADGINIFANGYIGNTSYIFNSKNSGFSWVSNNAPNLQWSGIACSTNGKVVYACARLGSGIYKSTDGGITWTLTGAPSMDWGAIVSSADGSRLVAGANSGNVYASFDMGNTWTNTGQSFSGGLALSADGTKLVMTSALGVLTGTLIAPPNRFFISSSNDAGVKLQFTGLSSYPYILQSTTNLVFPNWKPVVTNYTDLNGNWSFTDTNSKNYLQRFYRALQQ